MRLTLLIAIALAAGCGPAASTVVEQPPSLVADTSLGVNDVFEVSVYGEPDMTKTFKLGSEGTIDFPLIGPVKVVGLDPQQVSKLIATKLADGYLRNPQVSVFVKEQMSKKLSVLGQVSKPGTYTFVPNMTIVEGITVAGGFTPLAAKNDTTLTRIENGQKTTIKIPVEDIANGRARNAYLRPGDIINVPERLF